MDSLWNGGWSEFQRFSSLSTWLPALPQKQTKGLKVGSAAKGQDRTSINNTDKFLLGLTSVQLFK